MKNCARETTTPLRLLPSHGHRPHVLGVRIGDIVHSKHGRAMSVKRTDEYVITGDDATGPYCSVAALDDANANFIWPRHCYTLPGDTQSLDLGF